MNIREQSPLWRRVSRILARKIFHWAENNGDSRTKHNGEVWLLRKLVAGHVEEAKRPFIVFDAGANVGDYTSLVLDIAHQFQCPIEVHAFEPAPFNIARLRERFATNPRVMVVPMAVGDCAGECSLYAGGTGSTLASLVPRNLLGGGLSDVTSVPVIRLDQYLAQTGIKHVDLLKLDVEGFEFAALRGSGSLLESYSFDIIQFEYGGTTLDAGVSLRQIVEWLARKNYRIAKLFPHALELRNYSEWMENYDYANYVALSPRWYTPGRIEP